MVVHAFLLRSLEYPQHRPGDALSDFHARYEELTRRADLVVLNGHANYGQTNAHFATLGDVTPGQYRMVLINTCTSYVYGAAALEEAHRAANRGAANPAGYLDLLLTGMPSPGHEIAFTSRDLVDGIATGGLSCWEILAPMPSDTKVVVVHDEDNLWSPDDGDDGMAPPDDDGGEPTWEGIDETGTDRRDGFDEPRSSAGSRASGAGELACSAAGGAEGSLPAALLAVATLLGRALRRRRGPTRRARG